ncbi:uncharacterized protein LOC109919599 isoform X2 [Rhincodon typus]|uniref:uncharacterized protein LOC109919599 isoform X2 n=1 Tax=Rhincodon typus TaxID=259920 RepID=UPI002030BE5D|nr:uncharacterized protein LOC109919599 isoform X2 [Rhincodon typus]
MKINHVSIGGMHQRRKLQVEGSSHMYEDGQSISLLFPASMESADCGLFVNKYPGGGWSCLKVLLWLLGIMTGLVAGKFLFHQRMFVLISLTNTWA